MLKNKNIFITGATKGLGKAILDEVIKNGGNVFFTYRKSEELANKICNEYNNCYCIKADASDFEQAQKAAIEAIEKFGRIDVLINNAGEAKHKFLKDLSFDDWEYSIKNTLYPVFNYTKVLSNHFIENKQGTIINIGSINGLRGREKSSPYCAAKAGIVGFSKTIAKELGEYNIRCNVVAPGYISTEGH